MFTHPLGHWYSLHVGRGEGRGQGRGLGCGKEKWLRIGETEGGMEMKVGYGVGAGSGRADAHGARVTLRSDHSEQAATMPIELLTDSRAEGAPLSSAGFAFCATFGRWRCGEMVVLSRIISSCN